MNRTPGNEPSNPIARAFSKFFERGKVGNRAETQARPAAGTTPRVQSGAPVQPPRPGTGAPMAGAAPRAAAPAPATQRAGTSQPQTATAASPAPVAAPRTYTVEKGDSLSKIAQRVYGRADRWTLIFEANRDKISDPDRIYPGQVLVVPDLKSMH